MTVYFVGAGPGDPELLTRKADRLIREATVCIYAGSLVSPEVLSLLPERAERHDSAALSHPEVIFLIQAAHARNLDVVRLHTGDPTLYGAIGEQIEDLEKIGIICEVIPGVSSFQAAAAALKWELTVPEVAQSVVLTRTPGRTPMPESEDLARFAATGATLCLFLSVHALKRYAKTLSAHYGKNCPAAVVFHASRPDEKIITGTLADIAAKTEAAGIDKTAMVIIRKRGGEAKSRLYDPDFAHGYRGKKP